MGKNKATKRKGKTMKTNKQITAAAAYEETHVAVQSKLDRIRELLFDLPAPGNDDCPIDWGHVGSMAHVNAELSEIIEHLES